MIERKLAELSERLKHHRQELAILDEQLVVLDDDASDANLRALVAETAMAQAEANETQRHADTIRTERDRIQRSIQRIRNEQDALLDQLAMRASAVEER